jgi:hypothetical protein
MKLLPEKCPIGHTTEDWDVFKGFVPSHIAPLLIAHPGCAQYAMIASAYLGVSIVPQINESNMIAHAALEIALKRGFGTAAELAKSLSRCAAPVSEPAVATPTTTARQRRRLPSIELAERIFATQDGTVTHRATWTERFDEIEGDWIIQAIRATDCDDDSFSQFVDNVSREIQDNANPICNGDQGGERDHETDSSEYGVDFGGINGENEEAIRDYMAEHFPAYLMMLDGEDGDEPFDSEDPDRGTISEVAQREIESIR